MLTRLGKRSEVSSWNYLRALLALVALSACAPELMVGKWVCKEPENPSAAKTDPLEVPWSTSFEDRFCDYAEPAGFCYAVGQASYEIVTSPVHSGRYAAAFHVMSDDADSIQTRCVRQGVLPRDAYYGAWYFLPTLATHSAVWNLIHFQGGDVSRQHGLWDISLVNGPSGELQLVVFDFLSGVVRTPQNLPPIPIGTWFHLQFHLVRASDATGEVALYLNGRQLFETKNVITDDSDFGQWYVGNYAEGLMPSDSTLYVDDVTIDSSL